LLILTLEEFKTGFFVVNEWNPRIEGETKLDGLAARCRP